MKRAVILSAALLNINFAFATLTLTPTKAAQYAGQMEALFDNCEGALFELREHYDEMNGIIYFMDPRVMEEQYRFGKDLLNNALKTKSCSDLVSIIKHNIESITHEH